MRNDAGAAASCGIGGTIHRRAVGRDGEARSETEARHRQVNTVSGELGLPGDRIVHIARGHGREETEALTAAGVSIEIVPGITSRASANNRAGLREQTSL